VRGFGQLDKSLDELRQVLPGGSRRRSRKRAVQASPVSVGGRGRSLARRCGDEPVDVALADPDPTVPGADGGQLAIVDPLSELLVYPN
jgi:hypothetical protein